MMLFLARLQNPHHYHHHLLLRLPRSCEDLKSQKCSDVLCLVFAVRQDVLDKGPACWNATMNTSLREEELIDVHCLSRIQTCDRIVRVATSIRATYTRTTTRLPMIIGRNINTVTGK